MANNINEYEDAYVYLTKYKDDVDKMQTQEYQNKLNVALQACRAVSQYCPYCQMITKQYTQSEL